MRGALMLLVLLPLARADDGPERTVPLLNVELVDGEGLSTRLAGFHRVSGEDFFRGYLGSADVEIPYARVHELRIAAPEQPGGRMRARFELRTGKTVDATFDEREAEQLFVGFADFGRVSVYFRDLRRLKILGRTARRDLPTYGPPAAGIDARLTDREGVVTELLRFRRVAGENTIPGVRGATRIAIPLRLLERLELEPHPRAAYQDARALLREGRSLVFRLPVYEEETTYRGEAEFGSFRIRLGAVRLLEVHRVTPQLRERDPLEAAADGRSGTETDAEASNASPAEAESRR